MITTISIPVIFVLITPGFEGQTISAISVLELIQLQLEHINAPQG